jgi:hypothetical protein
VAVGLALAPWLWLLGLLAVLRSIPVAFGNTLLHTHSARVLTAERATPIFSLAPMPRNAGSLLFPLLAAASAVVAPGAALAVGAIGYGGTFLAGLRLGRVTRDFRLAADGARRAGDQASPAEVRPPSGTRSTSDAPPSAAT